MKQYRHKALATLTLFVIGVALSRAAGNAEGDATKAESLVTQACASCHGADGNSPVPTFPRLAGQHAAYLVKELRDYKSGKRASEVMAPFAAALSDDDIANLGAYFAKQKPTPGAVSNPALLAAGKKVYLQGNPDSGVPSCDGCHEENGAGSDRFPRIAGQNVEYTLEQLKLYAAGKRTNGKRVMITVAERMTEQETRAVAEYMASLP